MNISIGMMVIHPQSAQNLVQATERKKNGELVGIKLGSDQQKKNRSWSTSRHWKATRIQKFQKHQPLITWIYPQRRELNMAMDFNFENL